jgi:hypothetical protein
LHASALTEAIVIVPSSWMSIVVPVSSVSARMTAPPLPITSRIFSGLILNVIMRGACCDTSVRACGSAFLHQVQDVHPALARLRQRDRHDLLGDALDLDVHLQRRDAAVGARRP